MGHEISAAFGLTLAVVDTRNQMAMNVGMEKSSGRPTGFFLKKLNISNLCKLKVFNKSNKSTRPFPNSREERRAD